MITFRASRSYTNYELSICAETFDTALRNFKTLNCTGKCAGCKVKRLCVDLTAVSTYASDRWGKNHNTNVGKNVGLSGIPIVKK